MKKIQCENCRDCAIRDKCDAADKVVANSCITDHSVLLEIYEQGKADGRKEAIDECIKILRYIPFYHFPMDDETIDYYLTLKMGIIEKFEKLKEQKE